MSRFVVRPVPEASDSRGAVRRGGALVMALALLALGAALLAGSSAAARSTARAAVSHEAIVLADAESRLVVAEFMAAWNSANDAIPVGGGQVRTIGPRSAGSGAALVRTRLLLHRLSRTRYVVATDCQVGPDNAVLARRRLHLLLERPARADSTAPLLLPALVRRWGVSDLF